VWSGLPPVILEGTQDELLAGQILRQDERTAADRLGPVLVPLLVVDDEELVEEIEEAGVRGFEDELGRVAVGHPDFLHRLEQGLGVGERVLVRDARQRALHVAGDELPARVELHTVSQVQRDNEPVQADAPRAGEFGLGFLHPVEPHEHVVELVEVRVVHDVKVVGMEMIGVGHPNRVADTFVRTAPGVRKQCT
jgi:hypothetical protein